MSRQRMELVSGLYRSQADITCLIVWNCRKKDNVMKKIVASVFALSLLGMGAANAAVVIGIGTHGHHHHHRHKVCSWHHHHRVCHWR